MFFRFLMDVILFDGGWNFTVQTGLTCFFLNLLFFLFIVHGLIFQWGGGFNSCLTLIA